MRYLRTAGWALAAAVLLALSTLQFGPLPPLGPLLDPVAGIWSAGHQARPLNEGEVRIQGLEDPVEGVVDRRGVPHLFAASDLDAWRALGWLHARDRLFQVELQSRATEGTLTEWVGSPALRLDREMRTLGLARVADSLWAGRDSASLQARAIEAYADGVNARIAALTRRDLPFEYHLLHVRPRPWRPVYTLYLFERMNYTLSWQETDLQREAMATMVGERAAAALLPAVAPIQEPIVSSRGPRLIDRPLPPAEAPRRHAGERRIALRDQEDDLIAGSNNWVVAPGRAANGHALLAGDPHLDLTLPSIWYEAHLVSRDGLDIHGVTLPGEPAVLIGFTRGVAWSFTNSEGDFVDHYLETVDDEAHPTAHQVDGSWYPVAARVDTLRGRRGVSLMVDTFYSTRRGPLVRYAGGWRSVRWTGLEVKDPLGSFFELQRAGSVADFARAHGRMEAPAQNGVAADTAGHILELTAGRFPRRPSNDGGAIVDGTTERNDWRGDLPPLPITLDPARGYLFSANQQIVDPRNDAAYRGNFWAPPWRALRLARLLSADSSVTVETIRGWQTDPSSERATWWLPVMIAALGDDPALLAARDLLATWHDGYRPDARGAALFESAMDQLPSLTWDELLVEGRAVAWPSPGVLAALRDRPEDPWWDRRDTPERETRDDLLRAAVAGAWTRLIAPGSLGPDTATWRWDRFRTGRIPHIAFLPGLGASGLSMTGGNGTLSPLAGEGSHGASWRMIVELGTPPTAWVTYPGGQSGDPASDLYDDRLEEWREGRLSKVLTPRSAAEIPASDRRETIRFVPGHDTHGLDLSGFAWWLVPLGGATIGLVGRRRGWSAWWGAVAGAAIWGGALLLTWEPGASLRLATRLGGVFGGAPAWAAILIVPLWAAVLAGTIAAAVRSFPEGRDRA